MKNKGIILLIILMCTAFETGTGKAGDRSGAMIDTLATMKRLEHHLRVLTVGIGERSLYTPGNLEKAAAYIESFYRENGIEVHQEPYLYEGLTINNVVAEIAFRPNPTRHYLLGAHYDSVAGTVGADDNASAIAVQLETARYLNALKGQERPDLAVTLVSFALEEPPIYGSRYMGSRVYAKKLKEGKKKCDGMICLEMVGYTCHDPGCQGYPFPLMFFGYPKEGHFIGLVGNISSMGLTRSLFQAFHRNKDLPVVKLTVPFKGGLIPAVRLSDHASFWDAGFKAVMITDSAFYRNPHYHLASDTMEKLDYRFMAELVESLLFFFTASF